MAAWAGRDVPMTWREPRIEFPAAMLEPPQHISFACSGAVRGGGDMKKTKKAAPEPLRWVEIMHCESGYYVRRGGQDFGHVPGDSGRWAFTTLAEALAFVRRRMKGADG